MITTATYAEAENEIVIEHAGEDIDLVIIDRVSYPAILVHRDMGQDWIPGFLDEALTAAGWKRLTPWDRKDRTATVRWSAAV